MVRNQKFQVRQYSQVDNLSYVLNRLQVPVSLCDLTMFHVHEKSCQNQAHLHKNEKLWLSQSVMALTKCYNGSRKVSYTLM